MQACRTTATVCSYPGRGPRRCAAASYSAASAGASAATTTPWWRRSLRGREGPRAVLGDDARLSAGLQRLAAELVPGGGRVDGVQRLSGGASQQTWAFRVEGPAGTVPLVLRRAPAGAAERARMTVGLAT